MKIFFYIIGVYATIFIVGNALAADLAVGDKVSISGTLNFNGTDYTSFTGGSGSAGTIVIGSVTTLAPGSAATVTNSGTSTAAILHFGIPSGATGSTGPAGQSIIGPTGATGEKGETGATGPRGASFVLNSISLTNSPNYSGAWVVNQTQWTPLYTPYDLTVTSDTSYIRLTWMDNIGIYNPSWCNVGIFVDDNIKPVCSGAWSGVQNTTVFNTQSLVCIIPPLTSGSHQIHIKHRSQYCYYGYSAFDTDGGSRKLFVEVLQ